MPVVVASVLRYVLIAAVQIAAFAAAQKFLENAFDEIRNFLVSEGIMSGAEADDSIAAEVLATAGALGANAYLIKSRLPLKIADKLRTTSAKASLSPSGKAVGGKVLTTAQGTTWLGKFGQNWVKKLALSFAVSIPWIPSLIQNFLDQGTFNAKSANASMRALGLGGIFQWPETTGILQPGTYTASEFIELFTQLSVAGAVGIDAKYIQQTQLWTQQNLAELINYLIGAAILRGEKSDKTAITKLLNQYIIYRKPDGTTSAVAPRPPTVGGGQAAATTAPQIQVYTGVVVSGMLGTPSEFVSRPDDMIQNISELKSAAKINLAAFTQSLPGRFYYEVAIVNSIKTQAGFTQKGSAVRIVSSYNKDGTPRYKTVYNKFAVMKVGVTAPNGKDILLSTITLGPVNVVEFQPTQNDLEHIAGTLSSELFTSNIEDIKQINSPSAVAVNNQPVSPPPLPETPPVATQPVPTLNTKYKVSTGGINLNLRAEADTSAQVLAKIPDGTILTLDPNTADHMQGGFTWHVTTYNGQSGYVAREYLTADLGVSTLNQTPNLQPASTAAIASLTPNQREQYDALVAVGASGDAAYAAASLVPPVGTAPASPKTASAPQSSTTSSSSSQTYSFTAKNGTVYKVKATSQSAAKTKAAGFAKEDGTSLK